MLSEIIREDGRERLKKFLADFQNLNTQEGAGGVGDMILNPYYATDMLGTVPYGGIFDTASVSSGTQTGNPAAAELSPMHPGVLRVNSSTTANSGRWYTTSRDFLLGSSDVFEAIIKIATSTNLELRAGFLPLSTTPTPDDGVYIHIPATLTLEGVARSGGSGTTTPTTYAVSLDEWYRIRVAVHPGATQVDFHLFDDSGTELWADSLSTFIPTAVAVNGGLRVTGGSGSAIPLLYLDYLAVGWTVTR